MGLILNKVSTANGAQLEKDIRAGLKDIGLPVFGALPRDPLLSSVRYPARPPKLSVDFLLSQLIHRSTASFCFKRIWNRLAHEHIH